MKLFGGLALTVALITAPPSAAWAQSDSARGTLEIDGTYACEGRTPKGDAYHGTVRIVRQGDTYRVFWKLDAQEGNVGVGIHTGDMLAVSYFEALPAIVVYKIEPTESGQRLVGQWTVLGADGKVFSETLTKLKQPATEPPATRPPSPRRRQPPSGTPVAVYRVSP
jgi:hypothetical protein